MLGINFNKETTNNVRVGKIDSKFKLESNKKYKIRAIAKTENVSKIILGNFFINVIVIS